MRLTSTEDMIPESYQELVDVYGSKEEAAMEEPELFSVLYGKYNEDSPYYDESNGYSDRYVADYAKSTSRYLFKLIKRYKYLERGFEDLGVRLHKLNKIKDDSEQFKVAYEYTLKMKNELHRDSKNFFKELSYLDLSMKRLEYILRRNEELFADVFS